MYDYNYLNYDVSLLSRCIDVYYSQGGFYRDSHNFHKNQFFSKTLSEEMQEIGFYEKNIYENVGNLFVDRYYNGYDNGIYNQVISETSPLPSRKFTSGIVVRRYEETIIENKKLLDDFCKYVKNKCLNTKIIFIFLPRYKSMEIALAPSLIHWKKEMYTILEHLKRKYDVCIIDFKSEEAISSNHRFYNDVNHLNDVGAIAFTSLLKKKLECV